jgi:hypothetical protein
MMLMVLSGAAGIVLALLRFPVFSLVPVVCSSLPGQQGKESLLALP